MRRLSVRLLAAALLLAAAACGRTAEPTTPAPSPAARAAAFLWARQGADGGWHSATYGLLKSGQALTPFVLCALLEVPESVAPRPAGAAARALAFLRRATDAEGSLGRSDPDLLEYPNYATAYALRCLALAGDASDRPRIARMAAYLAGQQYREATGFSPTDPAYGGWGFGGRQPPGVPGHMDLAHTRRVLEALKAAGHADPAVRERAETFLRLVQKRAAAGDASPAGSDGGFYFSPVVLAANKGLKDGDQWRSYATATCDGLLSLLAAGVPASDERVAAARAWLDRFPDAEFPAGVPDQPTPWKSAISTYHLAVRAEVERALGGPPTWPAKAAAVLAPRQHADGSFANDNVLMKEDDPLLCTALALTALR